MKYGKANGPDDILVEVRKSIGERLVDFLTKLFTMILYSEEISDEWRKSVYWKFYP